MELFFRKKNLIVAVLGLNIYFGSFQRQFVFGENFKKKGNSFVSHF